MANKYSDYFLSREEAFHFLVEKLGVINAEELFDHDKSTLLDQIILSWYQRIPFQNMSHLAQSDPKEAPNAQQATKDILNGIGGLCGTHGVGAYHILAAVGYDCYPIIGEVDQLGLNHALVLVKNLNNLGDLSLVDVGCGYPTFGAIALQVSGRLVDSTDIKCESFLKYKYVRDGNTFGRYHLTYSCSRSDKQGRQYCKYLDNVWGQFYTFSINPVSCCYIREQLTRNVYLNPKHAFNRMFLSCKYLNGSYLAVNGKKTVEEVEENVERAHLKFSSYEDNDNLELFRCQNFPEIPGDLMMNALGVWQKLPEDIRL
ncbi:uncharacterized protein LOC142342196 [Convolutriloba macropyga]|uniref:uncharacterized protein LOC142342196 n=1 Tax=Convolutriloba macropyga TaxID=536237 RepID=UPI003F51BEC0